MNTRHKFGLWACCLVVIAATSSAYGDVLYIPITTKFQGNISPPGPPPWIIITLDDIANNGSLEMTIDNAGLLSGGFVSELYLNFDDTEDVTLLNFAHLAGQDVGSFIAPSVGSATTPIELGMNAYKADGEGYFDIRFEFDTTSNAPDKRLGPGESIAYTITHPSVWLTLEMFLQWSEASGGSGPYVAAVHLQGSEPSIGGWFSHGTSEDGGEPVIVPEPASGILLALTGAALLTRRRKKP